MSIGTLSLRMSSTLKLGVVKSRELMEHLRLVYTTNIWYNMGTDNHEPSEVLIATLIEFQ